ncbi:MAG: polysaccharide pyruvyl transferase CsaB [Fimbriimonadaceae bacterium]|nr:polysaccharide pyruvyl transferase CsaB [Fimbriimonadaceae bacterium]
MGAHLLLAGYFGCGNLGDDAILLGFVEGIRHLDIDLTMLSGSPEDSFRAYGIRSVPRKDLKAVDEAIKRCTILVFPGGSIFQDASSAMSASYYNTLVQKAKKAGKKVLLLGQGVGPLNTWLGKRWATSAFNASDEIAVRDPASGQLLSSLGVKTRMHSAADTAFLLPRPTTEDENFEVAGMKTIGIAPRPYGRETKNLIKAYGELARLLYQNSYMPVLIELDRSEDGPMILEISKSQGGKVPDIRKLESPMQLQRRMARIHCVVAMRLHASILAASVGVPPLMISYDPKVTAFSKQLGLGTAIPVEGLTGQRLYENFITFEKDHARHVRTMERRVEELRKQAQVNIEIVTRYINDN